MSSSHIPVYMGPKDPKLVRLGLGLGPGPASMYTGKTELVTKLQELLYMYISCFVFCLDFFLRDVHIQLPRHLKEHTRGTFLRPQMTRAAGIRQPFIFTVIMQPVLHMLHVSIVVALIA